MNIVLPDDVEPDDSDEPVVYDGETHAALVAADLAPGDTLYEDAGAVLDTHPQTVAELVDVLVAQDLAIDASAAAVNMAVSHERVWARARRAEIPLGPLTAAVLGAYRRTRR